MTLFVSTFIDPIGSRSRASRHLGESRLHLVAAVGGRHAQRQRHRTLRRQLPVHRHHAGYGHGILDEVEGRVNFVA